MIKRKSTFSDRLEDGAALPRTRVPVDPPNSDARKSRLSSESKPERDKDSRRNHRLVNSAEPVAAKRSRLSPAVCAFLDGLAELIAESILEQATETGGHGH